MTDRRLLWKWRKSGEKRSGGAASERRKRQRLEREGVQSQWRCSGSAAQDRRPPRSDIERASDRRHRYVMTMPSSEAQVILPVRRRHRLFFGENALEGRKVDGKSDSPISRTSLFTDMTAMTPWRVAMKTSDNIHSVRCSDGAISLSVNQSGS